MGPALLLAHEVDHAYRTAAVAQDWARSRPAARATRRPAPTRRALASLRGRTLGLLHV